MSLNGLRVLVIDDDIKWFVVSKAMLNGSGDVCDYAASLEAAEELVRDVLYDVVILDIDLRDTQGLATLEAYRKIDPYTPVIVLGDAKETELKEAVEKAGAYDYISKSTELGMSPLERSARRAINLHKRSVCNELDVALGKLTDSQLRLRGVLQSGRSA